MLDWIDIPLGHFTVQAVALKPSQDGVWHDMPRRASTLMLGHRCLSTVRNKGHGRWQARIEGFEWIITPDMAVNRLRDIPGYDLTHISIKTFGTLKAAKAEINKIFEALKNLEYQGL